MIYIGDGPVTIANIVDVARSGTRVSLTNAAKKRVTSNFRALDWLIANGHEVYGVNTGVGEEADKRIPVEEIHAMQESLLLSHATGVGPALPEPIVRGMIFLRANSLAKAHSGVRPIIIEYLVKFLNNSVYPFVPAKGSVGASGDLAPSAHIALLLIGRGKAWFNDKLLPGRDILSRLHLQPLVLQRKEGLALINGTDLMSSIGALLVHDTSIVIKTADIISSMSVNALKGKKEAFKKEVHSLRPHLGQKNVASNLCKLLQGSQLVSTPTEMIQDAYSLRCIPQVHGACRDAFDYVRKVITVEVDSVTDNPLIFTSPAKAICAGHFHGEPVAIALDVLAIALSEIASLSERRTHRMIEEPLSEGLPARLSPYGNQKPGFYTGFSMAQETCSALVSENKVLAHPASVDSIPGLQEDHVSMGAIAARKAVEIMENVQYCLAVELLSATQALDLRSPLSGGKVAESIKKTIRKYIPKLTEDRELYDDIVQSRRLICNGTILRCAENEIVGKLQ
jgi:histidine ammonia-lyase